VRDPSNRAGREGLTPRSMRSSSQRVKAKIRLPIIGLSSMTHVSSGPSGLMSLLTIVPVRPLKGERLRRYLTLTRRPWLLPAMVVVEVIVKSKAVDSSVVRTPASL
jgi:hypothetical protein